MPLIGEKEIQWKYDNAEFTVADGQTNYDVSANESSAFNNVSLALDISIRTDQNISIKFNSTSNDSITLLSTESPLEINSLKITNIYITNASGSTANVKIFLVGR